MPKKILSILIAILFAAASVTAFVNLKRTSPINDTVTNNKQFNSVIVVLNIPGLSTDYSDSNKKLISDAQNKLINSMEGNFEVYYQYTLNPIIAMHVDKDALSFLKRSELVNEVRLDEAVPNLKF